MQQTKARLVGSALGLWLPGCGARLGYSTTALWRFFDELGYVIVAANRLAHDAAGMSLEAFDDGHLYPRRTTNYLAVARERRAELRDRAPPRSRHPGRAPIEVVRRGQHLGAGLVVRSPRRLGRQHRRGQTRTPPFVESLDEKS